MRSGGRASALEILGLLAILAAQAFLFARPIHSAANYDEGVYLAAVDALRHGQRLGSDVFAAQFAGFYDLLRGLSLVVGIGVVKLRAGLLAVVVAGSVGGWLVGRRFGGPVGGLLVVALLTVAPPLDLFSDQVIADTPALAFGLLALGLATLAGPVAAVAAGVALGLSLSIKLTALLALPPLLRLLRRRARLALAGFAAIALVLLLAHVTALGDLWTSSVTYHQDARSTPDVLAHPHRQILDQIPRKAPFALLAVVGAVAGCAFAALRRPLRVWPLWTWVGLSVLFLLWHRPLHDNHLIVFPFTLAVAAAATIGAAVQRVDRKLGLAVCAALSLALVAGYVQQLHRVDLARAGEPATNVEAARALERLTAAGARTIDDRPIVSFLAHRRVVGPLVDIPFLRFETGSLDDERVIRELHRAGAVVVSRSLRTRPRVLAALRPDFRLSYDRGGVRIYVRH